MIKLCEYFFSVLGEQLLHYMYGLRTRVPQCNNLVKCFYIDYKEYKDLKSYNIVQLVNFSISKTTIIHNAAKIT